MPAPPLFLGRRRFFRLSEFICRAAELDPAPPESRRLLASARRKLQSQLARSHPRHLRRWASPSSGRVGIYRDDCISNIYSSLLASR